MISTTLQSFFDELEKIAAGFQGSMLKSPIAKQLVKERLNWRAARGVGAQPLRGPSKVPGSPSPVLAAARAARPAPPAAARQFATPEQAMLAKLQAGMKKPSGAAQAAAAERVAASGKGYGKALIKTSNPLAAAPQPQMNNIQRQLARMKAIRPPTPAGGGAVSATVGNPVAQQQQAQMSNMLRSSGL